VAAAQQQWRDDDPEELIEDAQEAADGDGAAAAEAEAEPLCWPLHMLQWAVEREGCPLGEWPEHVCDAISGSGGDGEAVVTWVRQRQAAAAAASAEQPQAPQ
jgi:hypothetical protein